MMTSQDLEREIIEAMRLDELSLERVRRITIAINVVSLAMALFGAVVLTWLLVWGTEPQDSAEHDLAAAESAECEQ